MVEYAERRRIMVDTQVRPSDVTKFPIIEAMLRVPRENFVPSEKREAAYVGENIALGNGRVVLDPRTLAKMLEAVDIQPDELVLDVGAGLGYASALAAHLAEAVVALEDDPVMVTEAERALSDAGMDNVAVVEGVLTEGAEKHGPYDVVMVQGAVEQISDAVLSQIKDGGRIVALFQEGALGVVKVGYRLDGQMSWRFAFNASAPLLAGFEAKKAFAL